MDRSTQTNEEMDRQPLWALLAEEEFFEDELLTDAQRQRRRAMEGLLIEDQRHEELECMRHREARWRRQVAEREKMTHLPPPTVHRSAQRAELEAAHRHITLYMQLEKMIGGTEVWSKRNAHVVAQRAVESAQHVEKLRGRGETEEDGGSECSVKTEKAPSGDDARAKPCGRSRSRSRSPPRARGRYYGAVNSRNPTERARYPREYR